MIHSKRDQEGDMLQRVEVKVSCDGEMRRRTQFAQNVMMISTTGGRKSKDKRYKNG